MLINATGATIKATAAYTNQNYTVASQLCNNAKVYKGSNIYYEFKVNIVGMSDRDTATLKKVVINMDNTNLQTIAVTDVKFGIDPANLTVGADANSPVAVAGNVITIEGTNPNNLSQVMDETTTFYIRVTTITKAA